MFQTTNQSPYIKNFLGSFGRSRLLARHTSTCVIICGLGLAAGA